MSAAVASGQTLFARYAYPPNVLGYCGPDDPAALLAQAGGLATGPDHDRARRFDGAWPYLEALAEAAGIGDPLDSQVVEAYWVGGDLLYSVNSGKLLQHLRTSFGAQGESGLLPALGAEDRALAHHSFHVLLVYPWVNLLRTHCAMSLSVLQNCRIRWGEVQEVSDEHAVVRSSPLVFDGGQLARGSPVSERVRWSVDGTSLTAVPEPGSIVTMHWDWLCDSISGPQSQAVAAAEDSALTMANRRLREMF